MDNHNFTEANVTMTTVDVNISLVIRIFGLLTCLWIVLAHSVIIGCFIVNRSKQWTNYSKQILSLCMNDLFLGFASIFLIVMFAIGGRVSSITCSVSLYFVFSALCASVYHVLAICVYRALTLSRKRTHVTPTSVKLSVSLVLSAWIVSFCLCACPFIFWSQNNKLVPICQTDFLFGSQHNKAIGFFAVCYIIPIILTNIVYAINCCKLLTLWKKVFPTAASAEPETRQPSTVNTTTVETVSHSNRSGIKAQRRAIGTIGILLFFFNLFTVPLLSLMIAEYSGVTFPRNIRTLSSNVFILNSVVSPFVYAWRTKFLRTAVKELLNTCVSCVFICL